MFWTRIAEIIGARRQSEQRIEFVDQLSASVAFKPLTDTARMPIYGSDFAAGADLHADEKVVIPPGKRSLVSTGIAIALPSSLQAEVRPRSGLAAKEGITVLNTPGTIDADYRGEIKVILHNTSRNTFIVEPGDRIAQLVVMPYVRAHFYQVENLDDTARGAGGFGSTGV